VKKKIDVLLGLQWGDEGKGKVVDWLAGDYAAIGRFQGGPNAGHSLSFEGTKHVLNTVPSGIFHPHCLNIIGNGVVIDPVLLMRELDSIEAKGVDYYDRLVISKRAHLILPTHRLLDKASERYKGTSKIGSTLKGIGPTYQDKIGREGLRMSDLLEHDWRSRVEAQMARHKNLLKLLDSQEVDTPYESVWFEAAERLSKLQMEDTEYVVADHTNAGKTMLAEGAQGSLLDINLGTYPFVTSSSTLSAGACVGLGFPPTQIGKVIGVFKAYCTRVGSGPFPTELLNETGAKLREVGVEFGATTGRARRCGWLDLVALRHTVQLNGATDLIMTKSDVLSAFERIQVCTSYSHKGEEITRLPSDLESVTPNFVELEGWNIPLTKMRAKSELPAAMLSYIAFIEEFISTKISILSVGPDRDQMIKL
jgi:adenylosuccinate synthase